MKTQTAGELNYGFSRTIDALKNYLKKNSPISADLRGAVVAV